MTGTNDFIRLHLALGVFDVKCSAVGFDWPPPERIFLSPADGVRAAQDDDDEQDVLVQVKVSQLPDSLADHPHLARGAEYVYSWTVQQ